MAAEVAPRIRPMFRSFLKNFGVGDWIRSMRFMSFAFMRMFIKGYVLNNFYSFFKVFDPLAQKVVTALKFSLDQHGSGFHFRQIQLHLAKITVKLLDEISHHA